MFYKFFVFSGCCLRPTSKVLLFAWLLIIPCCHSSQKRSSNLRGDWKAPDTKRKQRDLGDCNIDDVRFWQLLRGNGCKNSRSWIVFGTLSLRGQFSGPWQMDGQTSEIIYRIGILCMIRMVWGKDQVPIYFCAWHILKAWRLCSMEKIKDNGVWHVIYYDFQIIMYMLIEPGENIETFMICGRNKIIENFTQHLPGDLWTRYFWTYCCQLGMWINFQSLTVVPPCCAYSKISIVWIKVETPMIQATHVGIVYFIVNLWMVGLWRVPHSNQDT